MKTDLINMEGKKLLSTETSPTKTNLDISSMPCGINTLNYQTPDDDANFKIVINR